ncbi:MAG: glycerol kinase [Chitinophagaceae bacterium]|nr:MAG: glycerol kinase [Chitinophagaceae bacterium]
MSKYILSIDQGTTSSRAILFNTSGEIVKVAQKEFTQFYPKTGWVEHDAMEIWQTQLDVILQVLRESKIASKDILTIGITNQRETVVVWDKHSGKPVYNAIVWQDKRTGQRCNEIKKSGYSKDIFLKTGLVTDSYFSATKIEWILQQNPAYAKMAEKGQLLTGTIDSWLIWNLTGGAAHLTDFSNASRTMLFNINTLKWDRELLEYFNIPEKMLPLVKESSDNFGQTLPGLTGGVSIPINGVAGDQQSALFGQACLKKGMGKNTYGTGCFLLMNTGKKPIFSKNGLLTTIAWKLDGKVTYALEGSVFITGAAVQWLRDGLKIISNAEETESIANSVEDTKEVFFVPAFSGLGAPYWDMDAKGAIIGLTRGVEDAHIVRATLEAIAYQTKDVVSIMEKESGIALKSLRVDGGSSANNFLMQFQSDMLNAVVERPENIEITAYGAALLALMYVDRNAFDKLIKESKNMNKFHPQMSSEKREKLYSGWKKALSRIRG